jgi:hypothetical protein
MCFIVRDFDRGLEEASKKTCQCGTLKLAAAVLEASDVQGSGIRRHDTRHGWRHMACLTDTLAVAEWLGCGDRQPAALCGRLLSSSFGAGISGLFFVPAPG